MSSVYFLTFSSTLVCAVSIFLIIWWMCHNHQLEIINNKKHQVVVEVKVPVKVHKNKWIGFNYCTTTPKSWFLKKKKKKKYDFFPLILNDHNYNLLVLNPISILREYVTIILKSTWNHQQKKHQVVVEVKVPVKVHKNKWIGFNYCTTTPKSWFLKKKKKKKYDFFPLILNDHNYNLLVLNPISILREYVTIIPLHQS